LGPGYLASFAEAKEAISARAKRYAPNAMDLENRLMVCLVPVVEAKDFMEINFNQSFNQYINERYQ
jgi:hypothetical protein